VPSDSSDDNAVQSMTGYGEGKADLDGRDVEVIIRTFNHDGTSIKVRGLNEAQSIAHKVEGFLNDYFSRGRIEVKVKTEESSGLSVEELDLKAIKESFNSLAGLADELGLSERPGLEELIELDLLKQETPYRNSWPTVKKALRQAAEEVLSAQIKEGDAIREDLLGYLNDIGKRLGRAEEEVPEVVKQYKHDLRDRIDDLMAEGIELEKRELEKEVAKFADKIDINEEISRARTHVESARETLKEGGIIGKKLKFITQELQREINTLGAKSKDGGIQAEVIEMKLALEKFKEQSRNLA
jgi:uncharacterized protein (TIGR00255 family)